MPWARSLAMDKAVRVLRAYREVLPGDQRRELLSPTGPGRDGSLSPKWGLELDLVGWGKFKETK